VLDRPHGAQQREARRRAAAVRRKQVRRRRLVAVAVLLALVALVVILATSRGGGGEARHEAAQEPGGRIAGHRPHESISREDHAAVERVLAYTPAITKGGNRVKDMALTFDDGPGPETPRIVSILRRYHVPATFFVLGRSAMTRAGRSGLRAETGREFAIGDHTMTHPAMGSLPEAAQRREIGGQARLLHAMGKPRPILFRPPFGSFDATTLRLLRHERMLGVLWSADTKDFERPGRKQIIYTAVSAAQPGAIVLMHDGPSGRSETVAALPRIIVRLRRRPYKLVTVPQMMRENPPPHGQPVPTSLSGTS
jgi:peptidoglycan/xylan/chitin deacetylase (PgdA/CDA1 family)